MAGTRPKPPKLLVLTRREHALLDQGERYEVEIQAHTQVRIRRQAQQIKDKSIEDFAHSWTRKMEIHGTSAADRRHVKRLIELLRPYARAAPS